MKLRKSSAVYNALDGIKYHENVEAGAVGYKTENAPYAKLLVKVDSFFKLLWL